MCLPLLIYFICSLRRTAGAGQRRPSSALWTACPTRASWLTRYAVTTAGICGGQLAGRRRQAAQRLGSAQCQLRPSARRCPGSTNPVAASSTVSNWPVAKRGSLTPCCALCVAPVALHGVVRRCEQRVHGRASGRWPAGPCDSESRGRGGRHLCLDVGRHSPHPILDRTLRFQRLPDWNTVSAAPQGTVAGASGDRGARGCAIAISRSARR